MIGDCGFCDLMVNQIINLQNHDHGDQIIKCNVKHKNNIEKLALISVRYCPLVFHTNLIHMI